MMQQCCLHSETHRHATLYCPLRRLPPLTVLQTNHSQAYPFGLRLSHGMQAIAASIWKIVQRILGQKSFHASSCSVSARPGERRYHSIWQSLRIRIPPSRCTTSSTGNYRCLLVDTIASAHPRPYRSRPRLYGPSRTQHQTHPYNQSSVISPYHALFIASLCWGPNTSV